MAGVNLRFFMLKRGMTYENLVNASGGSTADDVIRYIKRQKISATDDDLKEIAQIIEARSQVSTKHEEDTTATSELEDNVAVVDAGQPTDVYQKPLKRKQKTGDVNNV